MRPPRLALALLAGVLFLLAAAPVAAQQEVFIETDTPEVIEGQLVHVRVRVSGTPLQTNVDIPITLTDNTAEPEDHGTLTAITISRAPSAASAVSRPCTTSTRRTRRSRWR